MKTTGLRPLAFVRLTWSASRFSSYVPVAGASGIIVVMARPSVTEHRRWWSPADKPTWATCVVRAPPSSPATARAGPIFRPWRESRHGANNLFDRQAPQLGRVAHDVD